MNIKGYKKLYLVTTKARGKFKIYFFTPETKPCTISHKYKIVDGSY